MAVIGILISLLVGGLVVQAQTVPLQSPPAQLTQPRVFEYKIVEATTDVASMQRILNNYGAAGWELVAVGLGDLTSPRLIFKR